MRMKTEYQKMLDGEEYSAVDKELLEMLNRVKDLCWEYNQIRPTLIKERNLKLREILGKMDDDTFINQPFYCDYGKHIRVGKRFFANFGLTVLDEAYVTSATIALSDRMSGYTRLAMMSTLESGTPATSGRGRSTSATTAGLAVAQLSCLE